VEEQDVTIDGSRSRDPEGAPLTFQWTLVSAPEGSQLALNASSATFAFRPDVPGNYELQLTASDGRSSDTDNVRVRAEPLVRFTDGGSFTVERRGGGDDDDDEKHRRPIELELRTSSLYRGSRVPFTTGTDAPWLRVVEPGGITASGGEETELHVALVMSEVDRLPRGKHEAHLIVSPQGGWEQAQATVTLDIKGGGSGEISPYVSYTGQASFVTLYDNTLTADSAARVFVDDRDVGALTVTSDTQGTITLPALEAGEHTVRIGADGGAMRLVVRDLPTHGAADVALPGTATSLEYDAERDAFYGIFVAPDGTRSAQRLRNTGGTWMTDAIAVDAPHDVALTADGADLLVAVGGCTIHRLDPQTRAVRESLADATCSSDAEPLGALVKFVDGQPVAIGQAADATLWQFPAGSRTFVPLPNIASFEFADGALHVRELR
jgi:hypothetical protein